MEIPIGANHLKFYHLAKAKGIKIQSRYIGVYFGLNAKRPAWVCRVQKAGKNLYHKRFEFSEAGEKEAGRMYELKVKELIGEQRYKEKQHYGLPKPPKEKRVLRDQNICGKCGLRKESNRLKRYLCLSCDKEYFKSYKRKPRYTTPIEKMKNSSRGKAKYYARRGKIPKTNCVDCGAEKVEMHHEDYTKPLDVVWLCRPCHEKRHHGQSKF